MSGWDISSEEGPMPDWSNHPNAKHINDALKLILENKDKCIEEVQQLDRDWYSNWDQKTDRIMLSEMPVQNRNLQRFIIV